MGETDTNEKRQRVRLDMHTHSEYSPDSRTPLASQIAALKAAKINIVCATDHNTIEGALRLREMGGDDIRVIVGEEVSSRDGEIIGLFLEKVVPRDLSGEETMARIHEQGGLVSVPHPFSRNRLYHLRRDALDRLWPQIDCMEIFNAREAFAADNKRAEAYAKERNIPGGVGSDAHRISEIGRAWIEIDDFKDKAGFVESLRGGEVHGRLTGNAIHLATRYDVMRKWLNRRLTKRSP
ncbi:MAG TPA: PHP domain-containing protein [Candidatus Limnocylindrales bacterium]|nr:PHP domain-containing protein [Candidatus Limnocylindrales bacterium]